MKIVNFGQPNTKEVVIVLPRILIYSKVVKIEYNEKKKAFDIAVGCQEGIVINEENIQKAIDELNGNLKLTHKMTKCIITDGDRIPTADEVARGRCHLLLEETPLFYISTRHNIFVKETGRYAIVEVKTAASGDFFTRRQDKVRWKTDFDLSALDVAKITAILDVIHNFYFPKAEKKDEK